MADCKSPVNGAVAKNPHLFQPGENAREAGRKGGIRSGEERRRKKNMKEDVIFAMEQKVMCDDGVERSTQMTLILDLINAAHHGNVEAFKVLRDTMGEKPAEKVDVNKPDFTALDEAFASLGVMLGEEDMDYDLIDNVDDSDDGSQE